MNLWDHIFSFVPFLFGPCVAAICIFGLPHCGIFNTFYTWFSLAYLLQLLLKEFTGFPLAYWGIWRASMSHLLPFTFWNLLAFYFRVWTTDKFSSGQPSQKYCQLLYIPCWIQNLLCNYWNWIDLIKTKEQNTNPSSTSMFWNYWNINMTLIKYKYWSRNVRN